MKPFLFVGFQSPAMVNLQPGGGKEIYMEQTAEEKTAYMVKRLNLNETQALKVKSIYLTCLIKLQEDHKANRDARSCRKETYKAIRAQKRAAIQLVLTEEQFKTHEEIRNKWLQIWSM